MIDILLGVQYFEFLLDSYDRYLGVTNVRIFYWTVMINILGIPIFQIFMVIC